MSWYRQSSLRNPSHLQCETQFITRVTRLRLLVLSIDVISPMCLCKVCSHVLLTNVPVGGIIGIAESYHAILRVMNFL